MAFEVQPVAVSAGHWRLSIAAAAVLAMAVVGLAFATRMSPPPAVRALSVTGTQLAATALPANLVCHDVGRDVCLRATSAALTALAQAGTDPLGPVRIQRAEVWKSLLCSNTFDCPPGTESAQSVVLGSVTLGLSSGQEAWFNVVDRLAPNAAGPVPDAWIVRWQ